MKFFDKQKLGAGIKEPLTYMAFTFEHLTLIRINKNNEPLNRVVLRRAMVVGAFPDGNSALIRVCARLQHMASVQWGSKVYLDMKQLQPISESEEEMLVN